ncbi:hypothetical protein ACTWJ9_31175 (plasmid) [Streptomyces sp. GDS52]|uniref:hypothetical protein n=1 Tax=unclassified Streptomyces TaxID=2593676 RepID=UPI00364D50A2
MGSLFEELEARESAARERADVLEAELAELTGRLEEARAVLERLRVTRETVAEVLAEMEPPAPVPEPAASPAGSPVVSAYAGAERRVVGVLSVPKWQPGMDVGVLPREYRDILEVVEDAPGPVRAKQIVPRIGLPVQSGKIEGTRAKLKRLVERGWLDENDPGLFTPARRRRTDSSNSP